MKKHRFIFGAAALLVGVALLAACGGEEAEQAPTPQVRQATPLAAGSPAATSPASSVLETARLHVGEMVAAAEKNDLTGAETHLEAADPSLHKIIDDLEAKDQQLAADLDEAVEDAESDLEMGEEAEHIVEVGNEILDLLTRVQ